MKKILIITIIFFVSFMPSSAFGKPLELKILVASGLINPVNDIISAYEHQNKSIKIKPLYAGTQTLLTQLEYGMQADVVFFAGEIYPEILIKKGFSDNLEGFASNILAIGVNKKSKFKINKIKDLAQPNIRLSVAEKSVPIGAYSYSVIEKLPKDIQKKLLKNIKSFDLSAKSVLSKVELGDVDAGIVYQSDLTAFNYDKIYLVGIDSDINCKIPYFIGVLNHSKHKQIALDFTNFALAKQSKKILEQYGFIEYTN